MTQRHITHLHPHGGWGPEGQAEGDTGTGPYVPYKEIIGRLMYVATETWPDITFTVSALTQFTHDTARPHWEATKQVIRYLKGTRDLELTYVVTNTWIIRYTDTDYVLGVSALHYSTGSQDSGEVWTVALAHVLHQPTIMCLGISIVN